MTNKQLTPQYLAKMRSTPQPAAKPTRLPKAPSHLHEIERGLWRRIVRDWAINDSAGLALLESALEAHERCRRARESITKVGELVKDRFGAIRPHPLLQTERDSRTAWMLALKHLGVLNIQE